jgi:hypothetical protein
MWRVTLPRQHQELQQAKARVLVLLLLPLPLLRWGQTGREQQRCTALPGVYCLAVATPTTSWP